MAPSFAIRVNESTTFRYTGVMKDENSVPLAPTDLNSLTATLYDLDTGSVINSRNSQNVLNQNNFTLDSSGNLVWVSVPADSPIINTTKETEVHILVLKWLYSSSTREGTKEIAIRVVNLSRIP